MNDEILRMPELKSAVGLSESTIFDKQNPNSPRHDPTFPRPVPLGTRAKGYLRSEVQAWIEQQASRREQRAVA